MTEVERYNLQTSFLERDVKESRTFVLCLSAYAVFAWLPGNIAMALHTDLLKFTAFGLVSSILIIQLILEWLSLREMKKRLRMRCNPERLANQS